MSNHEKDNFSNREALDERALAEQSKQIHENLKEKYEKAAEQAPERNVESAKHEALEQAAKAEKERVKAEKESREKAPAERRVTKQEREASYDATMKDVQSQMSAPSRAFSKVIHNPVVEKASEVVGNTVARPNAIIYGSLFSAIFTLVIYLIAKQLGYKLSGAETIASFALGWIFGLIYDYVRLLIVGKNK